MSQRSGSAYCADRGDAMEGTLKLAEEVLNENSLLNIDSLLDALIALVQDCSSVRRQQNIDIFFARYGEVARRAAELRVKDSDFERVQLIGRGSFGDVFLVRHIRTRSVFAMKVLNKADMRSRADTAFYWEERDIMAHAKSEWIVQLHYAFQDATSLYMVMEYMPGGDLVSLMNTCEMSERWARFYTAELVLALEALHAFGYVHRDVKPDNMLLTRSGHIKLVDFGTCLRIDKQGRVKSRTAVGTPDYISPELLQMQGKDDAMHGAEVDWWAVGIVLYEMLCGETPFYSDSLVETYNRIQHYASELSFPDDMEMSICAKDLIRKFLTGPESRLGAKGGATEVKAHSFFVTDEWTFETIRNSIAPMVPELNGDDDTSRFDSVADKKRLSTQLQNPRSFAGNQLPFVGFTYANDLGPAAEITRKLIAREENNCMAKSSSPAPSYSSSTSIDDPVVVTSEMNGTRFETEELDACRAQLEEVTQRWIEDKLNSAIKSERISVLEERLKATVSVEEELRNLQMQFNELTKRCERHDEKEKVWEVKQAELLAKGVEQEELVKELQQLLDESREKERLMDISRSLVSSKHAEDDQLRQSLQRTQLELRDAKEQIASLEEELQSTVCSKRVVEEMLSETLKAPSAIDLRTDESSTMTAVEETLCGELVGLEVGAPTSPRDVVSLEDSPKEEVHGSEDSALADLVVEPLSEDRDVRNELKAIDEAFRFLPAQVGMDQRLSNCLLTADSVTNRSEEVNNGTEDTTASEKRSVTNSTCRCTWRGSHIERSVDDDSPFKESIGKESFSKESFSEIGRRYSRSGETPQEEVMLRYERRIQQLQSKLDRERILKVTAVQKLEELAETSSAFDRQAVKRKANGSRRGRKIADLENELRTMSYQYEARIDRLLKENEQMRELLRDEEDTNENLRKELEVLTNVEAVVSERKRGRWGLRRNSQRMSSSFRRPLSTQSSCLTSIDERDWRCEGKLSVRLTSKKKLVWKECFAVFNPDMFVLYDKYSDRQVVEKISSLRIVHVRKVTSADVRPASSAQLPCIFQVMYEQAERRASMDGCSPNSSARAEYSHDLVDLTFHISTNCDLCVKPLSNLLRPPPAVECKRCHFRCHRSHLLKKENLPQCWKTGDTQVLMLIAETVENCDTWVHKLKAFIDYNRSRFRSQNVSRCSSIISN